MTTVAAEARTFRYRDFFVWALIIVSILPAIACVLNFSTPNDPKVFGAVALMAVIVYTSGTHQWITFGYYADKKWRALFNTNPFVYYVVPPVMIALSIAAVMSPNILLGTITVNVLLSLNLWHHAKQNWGVLSLVAKNRGANIVAMRLVVILAWVAFAPTIYLQLPNGSWLLGIAPFLPTLAIVFACVYAVVFAFLYWRANIWKLDPLTAIFTAAIGLYFLPMAFMKPPWALAVTGLAHGMQYFLLVALSFSLAERKQMQPKQIAQKFAGAVLLIAVISAIAWQMNSHWSPPEKWDSDFIRFAVGLTAGVNFAHFWLDAFIWKLSDKNVRTLHGETFAF